jgi:hypothetical protein
VRFAHSDVSLYVYEQAEKLTDAFAEKADMKVDLNDRRAEALLDLAVEHAKETWAARRRRVRQQSVHEERPPV